MSKKTFEHSFIVCNKIHSMLVSRKNKNIVFVVPPNIVDEGTSGDMVAREGTDVSISCKADGRPLPRILWRREDGANIQLRNDAGKLHKGLRLFTIILCIIIPCFTEIYYYLYKLFDNFISSMILI